MVREVKSPARVNPRRHRPTRAQTRERVLAAAALVFGERGFLDTSLDDVAAEAGLTKGAIYSSFVSKDQLFHALMRDQIDERLRLATTAAGPGRSLREVAHEAGRAMGRATVERPEWHLTFIEFWTRAMRNPALRADFRVERREARALVAGYLDGEAARLGVPLPMPSADLATAVLALSNGLAIEQLADPDAVDPDLLGRLLEALLAGIVPG